MAQQFTPEEMQEAARLLIACGVDTADAEAVAIEALRLASAEVA